MDSANGPPLPGQSRIPGHPWMARAIRGWPGSATGPEHHRCLGGVGYATLHNVILDEGLEENPFSYQVVMGKGYRLQGEEKDVRLMVKEEKEVLWAKL